jgi:hypothetical protein
MGFNSAFKGLTGLSLIFNILLSWIRSLFPSFFESDQHSLPCVNMGCLQELDGNVPFQASEIKT